MVSREKESRGNCYEYGDLRHAAVRSMPKSRRGEWPGFLVLPDWAADEIEGPTMKKWTIYFQGIRPSGRGSWFIWQIWGLLNDWKEVRQRLSDRAAEAGLTCVYMYGIAKPMDKEMYDLVTEFNKKKEGLNAA